MKIRGCLQFYRLNQNSSKGCTKLTADYNSRTVTVPLSCFWLKNQRARISASSLPKFKPPLTTAKNNYDSKLIGFLEDSMGAPDLQDLILKKTLSEIQQPGLASIPRMEMHQSFIFGHCTCHRYQCKCFASKRFLLRMIEVDLHMTYLSLAKEIKVDVTINKQTFNGTVSVKSPKQLCFPLWKFPKITGCLDFYNVIHSYQKTQGCVRLKSRFFLSRLDLLIGCFQFKLYADGSEEAFSGSLNPDKINFDADDDTSGTHDYGSRLL